jgi:hypothetical protein
LVEFNGAAISEAERSRAKERFVNGIPKFVRKYI